MSYIKRTILRDLLRRLNGVKIVEDNTFSFLVRELNTEENKKIMLADLGDLAKVFKLPAPSRRKKIKKFTSSLIIHMAKECECGIEKSTKYFRAGTDVPREQIDDLPTPLAGYESTSGFYKFVDV